MERAFFTRAPNDGELLSLRRFLATYRDGSGGQREADGSSRADSRQIERCLAELLYGRTTENKSFYDFVIESNESGGIAVRGASIKSKQLELDADSLDAGKAMRAHLEISNSNSKDWKLCAAHGLSQKDFGDAQHAETFGRLILARQVADREQAEANYVAQQDADVKRTFITKESIFISVLYTSPRRRDGERQWMVSAFPINLPPPVKWEFRTERSLVGYDEEGGALYEWYGLSGSQFKYFPKLASRLHGTGLFTLPKPAVETLRAKSSKMFEG